eukprot:TRINITY_DN3935_c0_g1_i1.p2 TRINITY_DN3935_c0_g1~~TRINITY_DN3935_c0_g1_i1.p2  ORF type:complete len:64 (-),score=5.06 TRINITY_DN3935_c0_g1_i1:39-200(-)
MVCCFFGMKLCARGVCVVGYGLHQICHLLLCLKCCHHTVLEHVADHTQQSNSM